MHNAFVHLAAFDIPRRARRGKEHDRAAAELLLEADAV
jgi:hypothetical protein